MEAAIHAAISEYLRHNELTRTANEFRDECARLGLCAPPSPANSAAEEAAARSAAADRALQALRDGRRSDFAELWARHVPAAAAGRPDAKKLFFHAQVLFAVWPLSAANPQKNAGAAAGAMQEFRAFLERSSAELSKTAEYLAFYALPFVPSPEQHPSFTSYYSAAWAEEIKGEVEDFLRVWARTGDKPKLETLFEAESRGGSGRSANRSSDQLQAETRRLRDVLSDMCEMMQRVQSGQQAAWAEEIKGEVEDFLRVWARTGDKPKLETLFEAESRGGSGRSANRSSDKLQAETRRLRDVLSDMCEMMQRVQSGQQVPPKAMAALLARASDLLPESPSGSSPGSGASGARQGGRDQGAIGSPGAPPAQPRKGWGSQPPSRPRSASAVPLDYKKVAADLKSAGNETGKLSKSTGSQKKQILASYAHNDVMGLRGSRESLIALLSASRQQPMVREYAMRFVNALSFEWAGREYLLESNATLKTLWDVIAAEKSDSVLRQQALAAFQKLSMRFVAQDAMIEMNVIEWLLKLLSKPYAVSKYTLEYASALLLNLLLRKAGRERCDAPELNAVDVLMALLESDNEQVRLYTNGSLFSILQRPSVREAAREKKLDKTLQAAAKSSTDPNFSKQIEFIIQKLDSDEEEVDDDEDEEDDPEPEDDEESVGDEDASETLVVPQGTEQGEDLLAAKFQAAQKDEVRVEKKAPKAPAATSRHPSRPGTSPLQPFTRPVTPGNLGPAQTMPRGLAGSNSRKETPGSGSPTSSGEPAPQKGAYSNFVNVDDLSAFKTTCRLASTPPGKGMAPAPLQQAPQQRQLSATGQRKK
eukprot:m51a1_g12020 hypothetical protein (819) ;mRNA; r:1653-5871